MKMTGDKISSLSAILDFYSDRAIAHASFFLASFFGLFTVLQIQQNPTLGWAILYWILFLAGLYTLNRFGYYASFAQKLMEKLVDARAHN